jgi:hypothetical protein
MRRIALLAATAGSLLFAAPGHAAVICVPAPTPGCDLDRANVPLAVAAASDDDTIRIAPGSYDGPGAAVTKRLNFVGAGAGSLDGFDPALHTRLQISNNVPALLLTGGGSVSSLQALGGPGGNGGPPGISVRAVAIEQTYRLDDVVAVGGSASTAPGAGLQVLAEASVSAEVSGGAFRGGVKDGVVAGAGVDVSAQQMVPGTASLTMDGSLLEGLEGLSATRADVTLARTRVVAPGGGVRVTGAMNEAKPTNLTLVNSLVEVAPSGPSDASGVNVGTLGVGPATLRVRGSTILVRGEGPLSGVSVGKVSTATGELSGDLRNTIVRVEGPAAATGADLVADRATISADFTSFTTAIPLNGAVVPAPGSASNLTGDPLLRPDLALLADSPLIDRGDPTVVGAGELDLGGNPRSADGDGDCVAAPDIGAFERADACPPNVAPDVSAVSMTNKVFAPKRAGASAAQKRKRRVNRGTTFRYTLSEPARVTITIERQLKGRRVRGKCRTPTGKNRRRRACKRFKRAGVLRADEGAGRQSTTFSGRFGRRALKRGRYRARLVATDPQGARSAERRLRFRVVRP